jgi:hypothetical protein
MIAKCTNLTTTITALGTGEGLLSRVRALVVLEVGRLRAAKFTLVAGERLLASMRPDMGAKCTDLCAAEPTCFTEVWKLATVIAHVKA